MKKIALSSIFVVFTFVFAFYVGSVNDWGNNPNWIPVNYESRSPASLLDDLDIQVFGDMFSLKTFNKEIYYKTESHIWTDKDGEYLQSKAKLALHDALMKTISDATSTPDGEEKKSTLKANIVGSFVHHFLKTLYIFKIMNGTFQIDLKFVPQQDSASSFENELKSNQLINLGSTESLSKYLADTDNSIPAKIISVTIPVSDELYQYVGGAMTIWLKVLDLSWNPLNPIPNPPKNAVKGFVRFRRYFRINELNKLQINIQSESFKIDQQKVESEKDQQYLTADLYYEMNLKNIVPKIDRIEVTPGVLLPVDIRKGNFFGRLFSKKEKKIKTGVFKLKGSGQYQGENIKFNMDIKKIIWEIGDNKKSPELEVRLTTDSFDQELEDGFSSIIKEQIQKDVGSQIISTLKFDRFFTKLK